MTTPDNQPPIMTPTVDEKTGSPIEKSTSNELGQGVAIDFYTLEEERRVVRKIDCVVLPLVCKLINYDCVDSTNTCVLYIDVSCLLLPISR